MQTGVTQTYRNIISCPFTTLTTTLLACVVMMQFNLSYIVSEIQTFVHLYHKTMKFPVLEVYSPDYNLCSSLKEVSNVFTKTRTKTLSSSSLDDSVIEAIPLFDEKLLKVVDIVRVSCLRNTPDFVVV